MGEIVTRGVGEMRKGHALVFSNYCLCLGGIRGELGVKKGSKRAHLPMNRSINVIERKIVRRGVKEMWKGHVLIFFNYFLCFKG